MCGYQGWFSGKTDGCGLDWRHYSKTDLTAVPQVARFEPGFCHIDYWPDVSELDADELFPTSFNFGDGTVANVYSCYKKKSVVRHYRWMHEYGIDGTFIQRFAVSIRAATSGQLKLRNFNDTVLQNCISGAKLYSRSYSIMYDMTGAVSTDKDIIINDWKHLVDVLKITSQSPNNYLNHNNKPLVCLWGVGFADPANQGISLNGMDSLITFFKTDPIYGGCTVLLGVPFFWRDLTGDAATNPQLLNIIKNADFIQPWAIGRFNDIKYISQTQISKNGGLVKETYAQAVAADLSWCTTNGIGYLPGVWPGSSRYNMDVNTVNWSASDSVPIPRLQGNFFWQMGTAAMNAGVKSMYACMFDEMDEGTSLFKCSNTYPVNSLDRFQDYEGLPSDHYLWLLGEMTRALRGVTSKSNTLPIRSKPTDFKTIITPTSQSANSLTISLKNIPINTKVYRSYAYVVPYGAPTVGSTRNSSYFATQLLASNYSIPCLTGQNISFVEVDSSDKVLSFYSLCNSIAILTNVAELGDENQVKWKLINGVLEVDFDKSSNIEKEVQLFSFSGQLINKAQVEFNSALIDLGSSSKGVYFVLYKEDGQWRKLKVVY